MIEPSPVHAARDSSGGELVAEVLVNQKVTHLFTLVGGHISPILVGAKARGIRVVDVRHEATAVFAADAMARLTGVPGVAVVTAGPGLTNTITAAQNALSAQSPVVIIGGATATILSGRGSLQDIDQLALMAPVVKWARSVKHVRDLVPALEEAFSRAVEGVPGPVFLETPVDLLYPEATVREWYGKASTTRPSLKAKVQSWYVDRHLDWLFRDKDAHGPGPRLHVGQPAPSEAKLQRIKRHVEAAERPVLVIGSQAMIHPDHAEELAAAVERLGIPVYLSGMARGLMGASHRLFFKHERRQALGEADLVILAGVPNDFRLDYGRHISGRATFVSINLSAEDLKKNRRPTTGVLADPALTLQQLSARVPAPIEAWGAWIELLRTRDEARERAIDASVTGAEALVDPVALCRKVDEHLGRERLIVVDGGDFAATAAYTVKPTKPLSWLDPGVFGTLGVGAGFALGAALVRPGAAVWIFFGDGALGYSLVELDTFVRHGVPVVAVVGNDASWAQIARDQVPLLGDDVATVLARTDYHRAAEALGAEGILVTSLDEVDDALARATALHGEGRVVLVNVHLAPSDFRKGSISM